MKISVITVTYNSAHTIEQTILSVLNQTYSDIEYIIIDGASTDNTLEIVKKYSTQITKLISEKDNGLYDALNKGIANASGDIIAFIHADDFYTHHDVIRNYIELFKQSEADAVYANLYYVDQNDTSKIIREWNSGAYSQNSFLLGWMPPHPTFFVRKAIYNQYGGFNLNFKTSADYELMLRMIFKHKIKLAYLNEYTVNMRVGGQSNVTLKNRLLANSEDRKAWRENNLKPYFFTLYLKPVRKLMQYKNNERVSKIAFNAHVALLIILFVLGNLIASPNTRNFFIGYAALIYLYTLFLFMLYGNTLGRLKKNYLLVIVSFPAAYIIFWTVIWLITMH